mmetsp:Transcript_46862/g.92232  ORF Transcript_46862/g.92232 Transcript_46862/m.92232 type:complete len:411 (-) Transcript_46862:122-1354(-)
MNNTLLCRSCKCSKSVHHYSKNQIKNQSARRCKECIEAEHYRNHLSSDEDSDSDSSDRTSDSSASDSGSDSNQSKETTPRQTKPTALRNEAWRPTQHSKAPAASKQVVVVEEKQETTFKTPKKVVSRDLAEMELYKLQLELVKLQQWVKAKGLRVVVVFEGNDAAGKGGMIHTITRFLNPRTTRIVALGVPSDREKSQWYFQRYIKELPTAGEIVLFDRSWYNRAGVERVMGFCSDEQYKLFMKQCPKFETMLVDDGIILLKYWLVVSDDVQEKRFQKRNSSVATRWKLSPMDVEARHKWVEYETAKQAILDHTDTDACPWNLINANDKALSRLNCIAHLLSKIPYADITPPQIDLPPRALAPAHFVRKAFEDEAFVPQKFSFKPGTKRSSSSSSLKQKALAIGAPGPDK